MAKKRKVVLTKLANEQISHIRQTLLDQDAQEEAEEFMDDFLDIAYGEIAYFAERFPICLDEERASDEYRLAALVGDFRVIFQILKDKVLILLVLHESELPF